MTWYQAWHEKKQTRPKRNSQQLPAKGNHTLVNNFHDPSLLTSTKPREKKTMIETQGIQNNSPAPLLLLRYIITLHLMKHYCFQHQMIQHWLLMVLLLFIYK